ncbi:MAG TPA: PEP/pyruvate-binding domain-containing protein [Longimicrobiaceae bacterium]|nr:PEP/pyruvate-binding domain-containing protein [Longimicrobiaceae bacterium]
MSNSRPSRIIIYRPGEAIPSASEVGGKAHNLARLAGLGVKTPPWLVIGSDAFDRLVATDRPVPCTPEGAVERQAEVLRTKLPAAFLAEVAAGLRETELTGSLLAVRSSAVGEDGKEVSFAGQFDSVLGVREADLSDAILKVWASAFNPHAVAYGGGQTIRMGVIIQAMVDPAVSGVAFGADPVTGQTDVTVVTAVYGLGEGLVSGELDADTFRIHQSADRPPTVTVILADKASAVRLGPDGGTWTEPVPHDLRSSSSLTEAETIEIAGCAHRLGEAFGQPQDVEWALIDTGGPARRLLILQTRPITTLGNAPPNAGVRRVWDNSNIIESYSGVTSPLTFSFARSVYEEVYRQFCVLMGVSDRVVDQNRRIFANMLGLVRGRVYYNLLHWYRVLALLPGYRVNRGFMERMMGVQEKLEHEPSPVVTTGKVKDAGRLLRMVYRLVRENRRLRTGVPAFHAHVDSVISPLAKEDLTTWSADRLVDLYQRLEDELLRHWQTPLVNDFFAMIWFGLLSRLIERWLPDEPPTLMNDLLIHEGGIISVEPSRLIVEMAENVVADPTLSEKFSQQQNDEELWKQLAADPACAPFFGNLQAYLAKFGDRCANELKLETITLREDPSFLLKTIRGYIAVSAAPLDPTKQLEVRRAAAERVGQMGGVRRRVFGIVLSGARARVRDRENLRFERTRVFGTVRRIFLGLGHHLTRNELVDNPRDIFYLTVQEVFDYVHGTSTMSNLRALIALRREEWNRHEQESAPPDRFESIGPVELGHWQIPTPADPADGPGEGILRGLGCCPGLVRAPVRIVRDPRDAGNLKGHILVAERTDPGWTLLFPTAEGLLVERGSLLSHSAIVAREVGLPCVVAIPALLSTLQDGDIVEMDGTTGVVRRLDV